MDRHELEMKDREYERKELRPYEKDHMVRTFLLLVVIVTVIVAIAVTMKLTNPDLDTKKGTGILKTMDETDVASVDKSIQKLEKEERLAAQAADKIKPSVKFKDALVMGDSITQGLYEYGVLNAANVQADRGTGVTDNSNKKLRAHIDKAKKMKPSTIFLCYGMNDLEAQNGDAQGFVKAYKPVIEELKKALPDTDIYVNSVLPTSQAAVKNKPVYGKVPEFNKALKALCKQEKVGFIDNTDLVEQQFYASDGVHMSPSYYKKWVYNMAEEAGL